MPPKVSDLGETTGAKFRCMRVGSVYGQAGSRILSEFVRNYNFLREEALDRVARAAVEDKLVDVSLEDLYVAATFIAGYDPVLRQRSQRLDDIIEHSIEIQATLNTKKSSGDMSVNIPEYAASLLDDLTKTVITHAYFEVPVYKKDAESASFFYLKDLFHGGVY
jgi:hypothetical protein